jgi:hypothetical protein
MIMSKQRYPFGSPMPGRNYTSGTSYRYGMNGQEKDDEIVGSGNHYTAAYWEYDSRLGRRWNTDIIIRPWESSYAAFHNNPIFFSDPFGDDPPEKLSVGQRLKNWFKGDSYKNKANAYAVKNKIDETFIHSSDGKITIDESYYTQHQTGSTKDGMTGEFVLHEKYTTFSDNYTGSGAGHGARQMFASLAGVNNKAANFEDMIQRSVLQFNEVQLTGQILEKLKNDPNTKAFEASVIQGAQGAAPGTDLQFTGGLELGGTRGSFNPLDPSSIKTWKVAANELTWVVRHADIVANVHVNADRDRKSVV